MIFHILDDDSTKSNIYEQSFISVVRVNPIEPLLWLFMENRRMKQQFNLKASTNINSAT